MGIIWGCVMFVVALLLFIVSKEGANQNKINQLVLKKSKKIAYIRAKPTVIIHEINGKNWINKLAEYTHNVGQEAVVKTGKVNFVLSYRKTSGIPGMIKIHKYAKAVPLTVQVRIAQMYEIYFNRKKKEFCVKEVKKMIWTTPLYKRFKKKMEVTNKENETWNKRN
ncbi:hypothetical protein [Enterococcus termitis]|nr:hypothetical protein [Enterococcus termitis]OJG98652.1 hypothetical protein RV18_GL003075 [Enterococcus termitis]